MAKTKAAVRITASFEANLAAIEGFLTDAGAAPAYAALLDDLLDHVLPSLERYPGMGRPFLLREAGSVESQSAAERLRARLGGGEIREYLTADYLVLCALIDDIVYLLAIRHHRQLSFNFERLWPK